jgi:hypothetical protein
MTHLKRSKQQNLKKPLQAHSYFAIRSQNEIYYQMASIFKAATKNEEELTQRMLGTLLSMKKPDFFVEKKL